MFRNPKTITAAVLLSVVAAGPMLATTPAQAVLIAAPSRSYGTMALAGDVPIEMIEGIAPTLAMNKLAALRRSRPVGSDDKVRIEVVLNAPALGQPGIVLVTLPEDGVQFAQPATITTVAPTALRAEAVPEGLPAGVDAAALRAVPATFFKVAVRNKRILLMGVPFSPEAVKAPANPATFPAAYRMILLDLGDAGAAVRGDLNLSR